MPSSSSSTNNNNNSSAIAAAAPRRSPNLIRDEFEALARRSKHSALFIASLHLLSRFLSTCALTWALVVLLAAFASALRPLDFVFIFTLLLLELSRLFVVHVFRKTLSRTLFRESAHPEEFAFKDTQYIKANRLDAFGQALTSILASASLISSIARFILPPSQALSVQGSGENTILPFALFVFYGLILVNSCIAILSSFLRPVLRSRCDGRPSGKAAVQQNTLRCLHEEVFRTAMDVGYFEADQLDLLDFAYTKLSGDYKRNIRPPFIEGQNKDLISYLYHNQQGISLTCGYLKSHDVWKQVVAANLPGFWAQEPRIELQAHLFWALRGCVYGAGKEAESALNSISWLGHVWADLPASQLYPFLVNDPAVATNIIDTLVHLLLEPIRPTLLFQLRAFEACCRNPQVLRHMYGNRSPQEAQEMCQQLQAMIVGKQHEMSQGRLYDLCCNLLKNVRHKDIWMATKIFAGNALLSLLCYGAGGLGEETMKSLRGPVEDFIDPAGAPRGDKGKRPYFWLNDMILVEKMRRKLQMPSYGRWEEVCIRGQDGVELPAQRALALIADL